MTAQTETIKEKVNAVRQQVAESLEGAADSVRDAGEQGAATISGLANGAGAKLDSSATLIRRFDGDDLISNLRRAVRRHPVGSLALGAAIGAIAGLAFRPGRSGT